MPIQFTRVYGLTGMCFLSIWTIQRRHTPTIVQCFWSEKLGDNSSKKAKYYRVIAHGFPSKGQFPQLQFVEEKRVIIVDYNILLLLFAL